MRVWDIHPGYLDRQRLLGEHRELHGVVAVTTGGLNGYAAHPEVKRWAGLGWACAMRHRLLAAEMAFRGYRDRTPVRLRRAPGRWPTTFIDEPGAQFGLLADKYADERRGRIPLPKSAQELWAHHKYSVLARSQSAYRGLGVRVSALPRGEIDELAVELVAWLHKPPSAGNLRNALQHMWGHVEAGPDGFADCSPGTALKRIQRAALAENNRYLLEQTALTELGPWM
ncbi:MAG: DUF1722 domain-containing protein [Gammaproteobacteria bacterium]|nr:DUF1722 domain-containing protein [Gammaproteobacteria bacterium]